MNPLDLEVHQVLCVSIGFLGLGVIGLGLTFVLWWTS